MNQDLMVFFQKMICQKIKDGAYVTNLEDKYDEYEDIGTHWIALLCKKN